MAPKGYSMEFDAEKTASARGKDMRCSPKASRNIAAAIKGMRLEDAKQFLEEVKLKKTAVPYKSRFYKIKHRKGEGFGPGAYPVKAADKVLSVLLNAENNAQYKDLETENLRIIHATAYRGQTFPGFKPRAQGRATAFNDQTTNLEIVLGEHEALDALEEARAARRDGGKRPVKKAQAASEAKADDKPKTAAKKAAKKSAAKKKTAAKKPSASKAKAEGEKKPAAKKSAAKKEDA